MEKYIKPSIEVVVLLEDIICTSGQEQTYDPTEEEVIVD